MSSELVIDVKADEIVIALLREKKLIELTKEKTSMQFAVGDIYLGKVKKIMPGLNAAFVNGWPFRWPKNRFLPKDPA